MESADADRNISHWTAEFVDPAMEAAFRRRNAPAMARHLRLALWGWIAVLLMVSGFDYGFYGLDGNTSTLLASRLLVIAGLLLLIARSRRRPTYITDGYAVTFMEMINFVSFFLLLLLRPELFTYNIGTMMVLLMATYVFVPNRLVTATAAVIFAIVGILLTTTVIGLTLAQQLGLGLLLVLPTAMGMGSAWQLQRTQREQYRVLMQAEAANEQLRREITQRRLLERELKRQAKTDSLTGLANRRHLEDRFLRERERARRNGSALTLVMIDLDHFKQVNDRYGHDCGDRVLCDVARLLENQLRQVDFVGRLGGEEFAVLLPDTGVEEAGNLIERLRVTLAEQELQVDEHVVTVTATFALAGVNPDRDTLDEALKRVDVALYRGKDTGRNRLVVVPASAA